MSFTLGTRLGPYEITAHIGAGGMGEVYRATDSNLKRSVAIKVLPASVAGDADRLARFQREAELLAALNHPNIAAIYGLEKAADSTALVMELVEGEDLSDVIARGPVALADALPIARQIADALETAHEHGIIHRDLKPANIKVRPDGAVKVLDFGLAKGMDRNGGGTFRSGEHAGSKDPASYATMTSPAMTAMGMILGTAAYMSPEQAKGRAVDRRADIWAFGVVLYEMLTGTRAFHGDDVSDLLVAVLSKDVDLAALPAGTPRSVVALIQRCLARDPRQRLRDIGEARLVLESPQALAADERAAGSVGAAPVRGRRFGFVHTLAAGLAMALLVALFFWWRASGVAGGVTASVTVSLPPGVSFSLDLRPVVAMSRDGSKIALVGNHKGIDQLYLRPMTEFEPRFIAGTEGASSPFFSPDGVSIGFFAGGKLKRVPAAGGPVLTLADGANDNRGGVWTESDTIIYTPAAAVGIYQVLAAGGTPTPASTIDEARHERTHRWPAILPDGKTVLVTIGNIEHPDDYDDATIEAIRLDTGARHTVLAGGRSARYVASGHLVFLRGKILFAVPFDAATATVRGTPGPIIDGISGDVTTGSAHYAVSDTGTIAFVPGDPTGGDRRLVWMDAQGRQAAIDVPPAVYVDPHVSPDGRRVAVAVTTGNSVRDVYVVDAERATTSRLTFGGADNRTPIWSHDGQRLLYVGYDRARNVSKIMTKAADGTGQERVITEVAGQVYAEDLTRDDGTLLFSANSSTVRGAFEVFTLALQSGAKPVRIVSAPLADVQSAALSPDGRWLAYYSSESTQPQVYVQSFETGGSRVQVSTAGGNEPHWAPDGGALYYAQADGLMMVPIERGPALSPGKPRMLFSGITKPATDSGQTYHIAGKGDRFLMLRPANDGAPAPEVRLILNWFTELRRIGAGK